MSVTSHSESRRSVVGSQEDVSTALLSVPNLVSACDRKSQQKNASILKKVSP